MTKIKAEDIFRSRQQWEKSKLYIKRQVSWVTVTRYQFIVTSSPDWNRKLYFYLTFTKLECELPDPLMKWSFCASQPRCTFTRRTANDRI